MRDIQQYKITSADIRLEKILKLISKFNNDETFAEWGVSIDTNPANVHGKKLHEPVIEQANGQ